VVAPPVVSAGEAVFQPGDTQAHYPATYITSADFVDTQQNHSIPADHQEVTFPTTFPVQSGDAVDSGVSSTDGEGQTEARVTPEARVTRQEFEALKATVKELCEVCNIGEVA
jgi:hypothetical protein